jgi:hypothetical protein
LTPKEQFRGVREGREQQESEAIFVNLLFPAGVSMKMSRNEDFILIYCRCACDHE